MSNQDIVQARQFQVLDRQGKVRAVFGMTETKVEYEIEAAPEKIVLQLKRIDGSVGLEIDAYPYETYYDTDDAVIEENASITLFNGKETPRLRIDMSSDNPNSPGFSLRDFEGYEILGVSVDPNNRGDLSLNDRKGRPHWMKQSQ